MSTSISINKNILNISSSQSLFNIYVDNNLVIEQTSATSIELNLTKKSDGKSYSIYVETDDGRSNTLEYISNVIVLTIKNNKGLKALTKNKFSRNNIRFVVDNNLVQDTYRKQNRIIISRN